AEVQMARAPEGWRLLRGTVFDPERERLKAAFGGYVTKDATVSFDPPLTAELRLETPSGSLVARVLVQADGPRPRAYFVGAVGKRLTPDGPAAARLFAGFRVHE
ncbi:MAG: hypothetical protein K2V38_25185, partial [Gemmataceae bacterium]|nr:hypothetical protein [Gemmataceae bacterium]